MPRNIIESLSVLAKGKFIESTVTFSRPNNTTQYSANDMLHWQTDPALVSPLEFALPDWARGLSGYVTRILSYKSGDTTTNSSVAFKLFSLPPTNIAADNAPYSWYYWTDRAKYLGQISAISYALSIAGGGCFVLSALSPVVYFSYLPNNILYAYTLMAAGYVPAASEQYTFKLGMVVLI